MSSSDAPAIDVEAWLAKVGLPEYAEAFRDNDIGAEELRQLTSDDLRELGVRSVGHRRRLLAAIERLNAGPDDGPRGFAAPDPEPLSPPPSDPPLSLPSAQRRQMTVLFCDLVGSTALSVRVDPEDLREFLRLYRRALTEVIGRYEGLVAQYQGDGVVAYFGYPQAHEHDAEYAVGAALAILEAVASLPAFAGEKPQVRIGIATGIAVVGQSANSGETVGEGVIGETPNLAARIQTLAEPNTVVIAPLTRRLVGELFECRDLGVFELKGFSRPIGAWQVLRESGSRSRFDALRVGRRRTEIIGREGDLARLRARLEAAQAGRGQAVLISGEAGLGKSHLVAHLLDELGGQAAGPIVLQASPYNVATPFHSVRYYLHRAAGIGSADGTAEALDKLKLLLARAGPVSPERLALIAELLRLNRDAALPIPGTSLKDLPPDDVREQTMKALLGLLQAIATTAKVIVVEDLQWIDPSTSELLATFASILPSLPVLLIATTRPGPAPAWIGGADARVIQLERLYPDETRRLVGEIAKPAVLSAAIVNAIVERSDGVPIFAEELTRGYLDSAAEATGREPPKVPSTLSESLLARLDRLEHGREIAPTAAVIAREFPVALLLAISPLSEEAVRRGIRELLDAGVLIVGHSPFGEAVAFRHALVRDAAYQLLLREDRVRLHIVVAETIETRFAAIAKTVPHILAIHLDAAGEHARAATAWQQAGADAARRSAYAEAVAHLRRALAAIAALPPSRERDERELELRLSLSGPLAAAHGYGLSEQGEEVAQSAALARRLGMKGKLVPALGSQWVERAGLRNLTTSYNLAREMGEAAADGSDIDRLIAFRVLGTSLLFRGEFQAALAEFGKFLALFDPALHGEQISAIGPSNHAVMAMLGMAEIHTILDERDAAAIWRERCLAGARQDGQTRNICHAITFGGCFLAALTRDVAALTDHATELKRLTNAHEVPFWRGHADLFAGLSALARGQEGFAQARRGIDTLIGIRAFSNVWYILYAEACEQAGRIAEGEEILSLAEPAITQGEAWMKAEFLRVRGRLRLANGGGNTGAQEDFRNALGVAEMQGARLFAERVMREIAHG